MDTIEQPRMSDEQREALKQEFDALDKAEDDIYRAMEPFRKAREAIDLVRENLLERHAVEIAGKCEGCAKLLFVGEQGHRYADDPMTCADCAPSWRDIKTMVETNPESWEEPEDLAAAKAGVEMHEAAGTLDEKVLHTL